ncbi:DUF6233 domain-containing protein [Streptomyces hygroscopicus]|uniref:DUF6233 domain-containing protein n=1 Tax=Streptomyces hygroscopicus TaxID=1912 RepID=UPI003D766CA8
MWQRAEFLVHRPDCAQAGSDRLLTDQEALEMPTDPEVAAFCDVCRPDTILRQLR